MTAAITSPARVLDLESHSSPETGSSESSLPPVLVAPMASSFLCLDDSDSEPVAVLPERHVSSATHDAMFEIPTVSSLPASSAFAILATDIISPIDAPPGFSRRSAILIRPGQAIHFGRPYHTHPNRPCQVLTDFTSESLPDSPLDSSSDSSSDHPLSDHSLTDHSSEDGIEEDIDADVPTDVKAMTDVGVSTETDEGIGLDVEPSREDFPHLVSADRSLEVMQLGLYVAMQ
ncbi:hypothetical protein Tco_1526100 [Tanacetum coccineum]